MGIARQLNFELGDMLEWQLAVKDSSMIIELRRPDRTGRDFFMECGTDLGTLLS